MSRALSNICVYCGSSPGARPEYLQAARQLGEALARQGKQLIYGGGHVGLMGAVADAVLAGGGRVTGVIPRMLVERELGHTGVTELHVVRDMHERKHMMASLADAFIALPGGWGTLEELTEMVTWNQLGLHRKPIGVVNVAGYYDLFLQFADRMVDEQFVKAKHRALLCTDSDPERLLGMLSIS